MNVLHLRVNEKNKVKTNPSQILQTLSVLAASQSLCPAPLYKDQYSVVHEILSLAGRPVHSIYTCT